jgi:hypothetical protein
MKILDIDVATMNCKGYENNKSHVLKIIKTTDICFLTETWIGEWDPGLLCDIKLSKCHVYTTSKKKQGLKKGRHGCMSAFVINEKFSKLLKLEFVNKRISVVKVILNNQAPHLGYAFIGVYMSSNNNMNKEFELDLHLLDFTYKRLVKENFKPIILGDLNADTGRMKYANDKILKKWLDINSYTELTRLYTQNVPNTFLNSRGQYSFIDHVIVDKIRLWPEFLQVNIIHTEKERKKLLSPNWKSNIKSCWNYKENNSDHRVVKFNLKVETSSEYYSKTKKINKKNSLDWRNLQHKNIYTCFLSEELKKKETELLIKNMGVKEAKECVEKINECTKRALKKSINKIHDKYSKKKRKPFQKRNMWWNDGLGKMSRARSYASTKINELKEILKKTKGAKISHRIRRKRRNTKMKIIFYSIAGRIISTKYKNIIKKRKKWAEKEKRQSLIESFLKNPDIFWKEITFRRGAKISVDISLDILKKAYETNFTQILKTNESEDLEKKMKTAVDKYEKLVKKKISKFKVKASQIEKILKDLKNKKTPGLNGCTNEMFKYGIGTKLSKIIANLFQCIIRGGFFPDNLNIGLICTIIKDSAGDNQVIENTRPITLSEVLSIILEELMLSHLLKKDVLHKHQFGFRKHSSCMHAVYSIKEVMENVKKENSKAYALYLDFSKAFDKVNRTKLMFKLIDCTVPSIWLLIKNFYENLKIFVKDNEGNISTPFMATVGVKQGGKASPYLFNLYINKLIVLLDQSKKTYRMGNVCKGVMVYADDTNVITRTIDDLNVCIIIIENYCMLYDIGINAKKTKWMYFGKPRSIIEDEIIVNGQEIEKVEKFKFLGVELCSNGSYDEHIKKRRTLFLSGITEINELGIKKNDVPIKMKSLLYTSLVRSKLTYGLETVKLSKTYLKKELCTLENKVIKKACGLSLLSKTTPLMYALNITPLNLYLLKRKLLFILQLIRNQATRELICKGFHVTLDDIVKKIGVTVECLNLGADRYQGILRSACIAKLEDIKLAEKIIIDSKYVQSIRYLLENRNLDNDDTLQYLLDPRRSGKG